MNVIQKREKQPGNVLGKRKTSKRTKKDEELSLQVGRMSRDVLSRLLILCGDLPKTEIEIYRKKAHEIGADLLVEPRKSWVFTKKTLKKDFDENRHDAILLIGNQKQLPGTPFGYEHEYAWSDFFIEDADDDGVPDTPVGRVFGPPETVLLHIDPPIIDSDLAVIFDSQPGRSSKHVDSLAKLGFEVEVLKKYKDSKKKLLEASEFILQFSDGVVTQRIHGSPEAWASLNEIILSYEQTRKIRFNGYPVVFAEACSTAQEGPLIHAFLQQGACYIGSTLDTINNGQPFDDWRDCCYCDGYKFGFLDLLDTFDFIGQVKLNVDRELYMHLNNNVRKEIEMVQTGEKSVVESFEALTLLEWVMIGNPLRRTTVGPNASFTPGTIDVDT